MSIVIRLANRTDAPLWIKLLYNTLGPDYPAKEVYDLGWVANQLGAGAERETFIVEEDGQILGSMTCLPPAPGSRNPVLNLGRILFQPRAYANGAATTLLKKIVSVASERKQVIISRVPITDSALQALLEDNGFICTGFQPVKHLQPSRQGVLFYMHAYPAALAARLPISHALAQVGELASRVLSKLEIALPVRVEDGATGYPLQSLVELSDVAPEQFEAHCLDTAARQVPTETSSGSHRGAGWLRSSPPPARALLAQRGAETTGGVLWIFDEQDRCVRIVDAFSTDDLSLGPLLFRVVTAAQSKLGANYIELDVLATAPRLLKTAEQLGFVPVAYFPGLSRQGERTVDVIKLTKLNVPHAVEPPTASAAVAALVKTVEAKLEEQKAGVGIVNLLRGLAMFQGLGDGELRKIAGLFQQKLVRPGETIFVQGGAGDEAFIVLRGQVEIALDDPPRQVALIEPGQIFGEQAFLDGAPRTASASVTIPTILLVVQRSGFVDLAQREPHLGMVVMRNMATELSAKLRKTTTVWVAERKA